MTLKIEGLDKVIKKVNAYAKMPEKADKILYELAELGKQDLENAYRDPQIDQERTSSGYIDRATTANVTTGITQEGATTTLWAEGNDLLFYEFGTGVTHNTPRPWSNVLNIQVPMEVSDIGTYNKGFGSFRYWHYSVDGKKSIRTEGIKARAGFANAINTITFNTDRVIKEVLNE